MTSDLLTQKLQFKCDIVLHHCWDRPPSYTSSDEWLSNSGCV